MAFRTDKLTGVTQEEVQRLFSYDPLTGVFVRKIRLGGQGKVGKEVGFLRPDGYRVIKITGRPYLGARLAWLYMTGEWPVDVVDHKNGDKHDDRWANLRAATASQNGANRCVSRNSTTRIKGVFRRDRKKNPFAAAIRVDGYLHHLGAFPTAEAANAAYTKRAIEVHGQYARGTS